MEHKIYLKITQRILLLFILCLSPVFAKGSSGIGIIIGNPTGLSLRFLDTGASHFNAALSWSFKKETDIYIHADYILKRFGSIQFGRQFSLTPTMGIGGRLKTKDGNVAVRVPFALNYKFSQNPFDLFIEIVPTLELIPASDFGIGAALALRYLF